MFWVSVQLLHVSFSVAESSLIDIHFWKTFFEALGATLSVFVKSSTTNGKRRKGKSQICRPIEEEGNNKHGLETLSWNLEMAILQWINLIRFNKQIKLLSVLKTFGCSFGGKINPLLVRIISYAINNF